MYLKKALIEWELAHWTARLLVPFETVQFLESLLPEILPKWEWSFNPSYMDRGVILSCVVWSWVKVRKAVFMVTFAGRWRESGWHGRTWKGSSTVGADQASRLCECCVLVQFRHNHTVSGQSQVPIPFGIPSVRSRKENMYTNKAKIFHRIQSHLPMIFGSGILWDGNFLIWSLWMFFLFYPLAAWTWVNFWHSPTCMFTKYNFLWFTLNLEPAFFLSWPASLGNVCCSWWKAS